MPSDILKESDLTEKQIELFSKNFEERIKEAYENHNKKKPPIGLKLIGHAEIYLNEEENYVISFLTECITTKKHKNNTYTLTVLFHKDMLYNKEEQSKQIALSIIVGLFLKMHRFFKRDKAQELKINNPQLKEEERDKKAMPMALEIELTFFGFNSLKKENFIELTPKSLNKKFRIEGVWAEETKNETPSYSLNTGIIYGTIKKILTYVKKNPSEENKKWLENLEKKAHKLFFSKHIGGSYKGGPENSLPKEITFSMPLNPKDQKLKEKLPKEIQENENKFSQKNLYFPISTNYENSQLEKILFPFEKTQKNKSSEKNDPTEIEENKSSEKNDLTEIKENIIKILNNKKEFPIKIFEKVKFSYTEENVLTLSCPANFSHIRDMIEKLQLKAEEKFCPFGAEFDPKTKTVTLLDLGEFSEFIKNALPNKNPTTNLGP